MVILNDEHMFLFSVEASHQWLNRSLRKTGIDLSEIHGFVGNMIYIFRFLCFVLLCMVAIEGPWVIPLTGARTTTGDMKIVDSAVVYSLNLYVLHTGVCVQYVYIIYIYIIGCTIYQIKWHYMTLHIYTHIITYSYTHMTYMNPGGTSGASPVRCLTDLGVPSTFEARRPMACPKWTRAPTHRSESWKGRALGTGAVAVPMGGWFSA